jgi:hypothetical protein
MNQLDLIAPVHLARARGHAAAQRAADKTERVVDPQWTEKAVEAVRQFARHQDGLFIMEMARGVIELQKDLPEPPDKRAWGTVTVLARDRGFIERVKGAYFPAVSSNSSEKPCYRRGPKA